MTNLVCIGVMIILSNSREVLLYDGFLMMGFFLGSSIAYFILGRDNTIVIKVVNDIFLQDKIDYTNNIFRDREDLN